MTLVRKKIVMSSEPGTTPETTTDSTKDTLKNQYYAELYTQLIIYGKSPNLASEIAKEAADHLYRANLPFPSLKVG